MTRRAEAKREDGFKKLQKIKSRFYLVFLCNRLSRKDQFHEAIFLFVDLFMDTVVQYMYKYTFYFSHFHVVPKLKIIHR